MRAFALAGLAVLAVTVAVGAWLMRREWRRREAEMAALCRQVTDQAWAGYRGIHDPIAPVRDAYIDLTQEER